MKSEIAGGRRFTIDVVSEGNGEAIALTERIRKHAAMLRGDGVLHLFVIGSTAALTTIEYEPSLVKQDLPALLQRLVPDDADYIHEHTWYDDNAHSHLRAAMIGPSLTVPFANGKLLTGEYQQVVLLDFDTRPRRRQVVGTVL